MNFNLLMLFNAEYAKYTQHCNRIKVKQNKLYSDINASPMLHLLHASRTQLHCEHHMYT